MAEESNDSSKVEKLTELIWGGGATKPTVDNVVFKLTVDHIEYLVVTDRHSKTTVIIKHRELPDEPRMTKGAGGG